MSKYIDFATHAEDQKAIAFYTQRFILNPDQLQALALPVVLAWEGLPFAPQNATSIAESPGVYAFVIKHPAEGLPPHGYVVYVGQTGAKKTARTLRQRFKNYFDEKKRPKRPRIHQLLNKWETCLFFQFATLDPTAVDLLEIEAKLNDAMMPPYSHQDFTAEVRAKKQIWEAS